MEIIRNKVADSGIQVLDLDDFRPKSPIVELDLEAFLAGGFVLREKRFRQDLKSHDWAPFDGAHVGVFCSTDAIVPTWAFMLVAARLDGIAVSVTAGRSGEIRSRLFREALTRFEWSVYRDRIVVIKGCGSGVVPESAYVEATSCLQRVARKIMYGEPCSTVPVWRKKPS